MNDLEFRKRAFSNPHDLDADFIQAAAAIPQRQHLLADLQAMDKELLKTLQSIDAPAHLATTLKSLAVDSDSDAAVAPIKVLRTAGARRYYALAASLVVAVGLTLSLSLQSGPSAQDLEFHDEMISHLYREEPRYAGTDTVSWQQISQVIEQAGGHLKEDEEIKALRIKFVNNCGVTSQKRGAHIVLEGSKGSVSVFLIKDDAVTEEFQVRDERFAGKIMPFGSGNLIIVGEKEEQLETYQTLITENFEWII